MIDEKIHEDMNDDKKILKFFIGSEYYAFPIEGVREIIPVQKIFSVPEFPKFAKGVINLRGNVIPIIDTRLRFHMKEKEYGSRTCIIIVSCRDIMVGFIVDTVESVVEINPSEILPPPGITATRAEYISGVYRLDNDIVLILDTEKMLTDDMTNEIKSSMEKM